MEERESPISGSPENTESGSPISMSAGVISAPPDAVSGEGNFNGAVIALASGAGNSVGLKKKRGRPRKYDAHGNLNPSYASAAGRRISSPHSEAMSPPPGFTLTPSFASDNGPKRGRGKASSQNNWNQFASVGELSIFSFCF